MRATLAVVLVLALGSSALAADRPQPPETFAPVVDLVKPAVLSVVRAQPPDPDELDAGDLLGRLFEALTRLPNHTLGAAAMVDPSGVAVTGARLLRGHTELALVDVHGRRYEATLIGRDERTDLALLRVRGPGPFPVVRLGDSDEVRVGDWVLAVGSPYGFEASVSAGIVGARARIAPGGAWGDTFQTDAAVNPGSAGGPLVNARGEMIGLASDVGLRSAGIAFAVPSNLVRRVVADLLVHGKVVRSWLGISWQPMTADLAHAFRIPVADGLIVTDVARGGPGAKAGLTRGAVVVAFDGQSLRGTADLERALATTAPGRSATLRVWRDAREATVTVVLAEEPGPLQRASALRRLHGLVVEAITPEAGVVVAGVDAGSPAAESGVHRGDVVRELNRRTIRSLEDFEDAADALPPGRSVALLVQRGRTPVYLVLVPDR
jgi:serine protease Do